MPERNEKLQWQQQHRIAIRIFELQTVSSRSNVAARPFARMCSLCVFRQWLLLNFCCCICCDTYSTELEACKIPLARNRIADGDVCMWACIKYCPRRGRMTFKSVVYVWRMHCTCYERYSRRKARLPSTSCTHSQRNHILIYCYAITKTKQVASQRIDKWI